MKFIYSILVLSLIPAVLSAHGEGDPIKDAKKFGDKYVNWHHADPKKDKKMGVSAWKAYNKILSEITPKKKIIVAVIDGGIDYNHEDLKNVMWRNPGEIEGNNIDDDNNGYVDDIYGWNFLGGKNGENINEENLEYARIYRTLNPKYAGKSKTDVAAGDKEEFDLYMEVKGKIDSKTLELKTNITRSEQMVDVMHFMDKTIQTELGKKSYTIEDLKAMETEDAKMKEIIKQQIVFMENNVTPKIYKGQVSRLKTQLDYYVNPDFNPRADIIGDDPSDYNDRDYGNPDVKGPDSYHGTFVAGLIGAERGNGIGIDGIANNVEIMALRAIPNGDEYDKDVALAIRYAVDNGAHIINMSFGKQYSPYKEMVDDAIKYAERKNVLLVNAAGNDHTDVDKYPHYPIDAYNGGAVKNMLTVGASSMDRKKEMPGNFSNYGQTAVDVFAPGVAIVSSAPESNYDKGNGTSYASPITAGVAALVLSYYPELSAVELKEVIMMSSYNRSKKKVYLPAGRGGKQEVVKFGTLSKSGGFVNVYSALKHAEEKVKK